MFIHDKIDLRIPGFMKVSKRKPLIRMYRECIKTRNLPESPDREECVLLSDPWFQTSAVGHSRTQVWRIEDRVRMIMRLC